jgi:hypothetical protein
MLFQLPVRVTEERAPALRAAGAAPVAMQATFASGAARFMYSSYCTLPLEDDTGRGAYAAARRIRVAFGGDDDGGGAQMHLDLHEDHAGQCGVQPSVALLDDPTPLFATSIARSMTLPCIRVLQW